LRRLQKDDDDDDDKSLTAAGRELTINTIIQLQLLFEFRSYRIIDFVSKKYNDHIY